MASQPVPTTTTPPTAAGHIEPIPSPPLLAAASGLSGANPPVAQSQNSEIRSENGSTVIQINNTNIYYSGFQQAQPPPPPQRPARWGHASSISTSNTKSSEGESPERVRDSTELLNLIQEELRRDGLVTINGRRYRLNNPPEMSFQSSQNEHKEEEEEEGDESIDISRAPGFSCFEASPPDVSEAPGSDFKRRTGFFGPGGTGAEEGDFSGVNFGNMFAELNAVNQSAEEPQIAQKPSDASLMELVQPLTQAMEDTPAPDPQLSYLQEMLETPEYGPDFIRAHSHHASTERLLRPPAFSVSAGKLPPALKFQSGSEDFKAVMARIAQIEKQLPSLIDRLPPSMRRQYTSSRSGNSYISYILSSPHQNSSGHHSLIHPASEISAGSALSRTNTKTLLSPKQLPRAEHGFIGVSVSQPNLHQEQHKIDLAFLFSSPLVMNLTTRNGEVKMSPMPAIDYQTEFSEILDKLRETGNAVSYRKTVSTVQNFRMVMTEQPMALHFSGHGIENNERFFPDHQAKGQGNFLVFEHGNGDANFVSEQRLTKLIQASKTKLEFVFVASCYSEFAGEVFLKAGAKHVVCVRRGEQISDTAVSKFSRAFYHGIFSKHMTVCQAFAAAKHTVLGEEERANEGHKFRLLKQEQEDIAFTSDYFYQLEPKEHCSPLPVPGKGEMREISRGQIVSRMKGKVDDFLGRSVEMHQLICYLHDYRLVTIKGVPGIGKTSLAKQVGFFLQDRITFRNGIIYQSVRGLNGVDSAISQIHFELFNKPAPRGQGLQAITKFLEHREVLFIIDNAEDLLQTDQEGFRNMIRHILQECSHTRCLLTSRCSLGAVAEITEKIMNLRQLSRTDTATLLFRKSPRLISEKEVEQLLSAHAEQAATDKAKGSAVMREPARRLGEHPIIYLLGGHPQAISLAAPLLEDNNLLDLYEILNSARFFEHLHTGLADNSLYSLQASLDLSLQYLKDKDPNSIQLFYELGLMPGGVSKQELEEIWSGLEWQGQISSLMRASLLVKRIFTLNGSTRWTLLPFMTRYAQSKLSEEDTRTRHQKILQYYSSLCKKCFLQIGKKERLGSGESKKVSLTLMEGETNIWSCLNREVEIGAGYLANKMTFFQMYYEHVDQDTMMSNVRALPAARALPESEQEEVKVERSPYFPEPQEGQPSPPAFGIDRVEAPPLELPRPRDGGDSPIRAQNITARHANALNLDEAPSLIEERGGPGSSLEMMQLAGCHSKSSLFMDGAREHRKSGTGLYIQGQQILPSAEILSVFLDKRLLISTDTILVRSNSHQQHLRKKKFVSNHNSSSESDLEEEEQEVFAQDGRKRRKMTEGEKMSKTMGNSLDFMNRSKSLQVYRYKEEPSQDSLADSMKLKRSSEKPQRESSEEPYIEIWKPEDEIRLSNHTLAERRKGGGGGGVSPRAEDDQISQASEQESVGSLDAQRQGFIGRSDISSDQDEDHSDGDDSPGRLFQPVSVPSRKQDRRVSFRDQFNLRNQKLMDYDSECSSNVSFRPKLRKYQGKQSEEETSRADVEIASDIANSDCSSQPEIEEELEDDLLEKSTLSKKNESMRQVSKSFQETQPKRQQFARRDKAKSTFVRPGPQHEFSLLGQLCVYYASCLALQDQPKDALRVIEIGLKVPEIVCRANLIKLRGLVKMESNQRDFLAAKKDFVTAYEEFQKADSGIGAAICRAALGYLYLYKLSNGEQQKKAKRYIEEALDLYEKEEHATGQAYCYYNLSLIVKNTDRTKAKEYESMQKVLQKKARQSNFINRWQGRQVSLFVEVATAPKRAKPIKRLRFEKRPEEIQQSGKLPARPKNARKKTESKIRAKYPQLLGTGLEDTPKKLVSVETDSCNSSKHMRKSPMKEEEEPAKRVKGAVTLHKRALSGYKTLERGAGRFTLEKPLRKGGEEKKSSKSLRKTTKAK